MRVRCAGWRLLRARVGWFAPAPTHKVGDSPMDALLVGGTMSIGIHDARRGTVRLMVADVLALSPLLVRPLGYSKPVRLRSGSIIGASALGTHTWTQRQELRQRQKLYGFAVEIRADALLVDA